MINFEIEFDWSWSRHSIISEIWKPLEAAAAGAAVATYWAIFQRNITKRYVLVVTFYINKNIKFLEKMKQGFKATIYWNKYKSEIKTQLRNNNLDYIVDPKLRNI